MNGARSTFMRKGYLLTALAAAALLAASPGTALAQTTTGVTITGPTNNTINEGGTATYTVAIRGYVGVAVDGDGDGAISATEAQNPAPFTVALGNPTSDADPPATAGEVPAADATGDLNSNAHRLSFMVDPPSNSSTTNRLLFTASGTISVATLHDNDAEDEHFTLAFTALTGVDQVFTMAATTDTTNISLPANAPTALIIDDDETQTYTLTLAPGQTPTEGAAFTVNLAASPPHEDGTGTLNVIIDQQRGWAYTVAGATPPATSTTVGFTEGTDVTRAISITQAPNDAGQNPNGDGNRVTDTVTVSAHTGVAGASMRQASLPVDVADANALQAVTAKVVDADGVVLATQPTSVEEGESVKIRVMPVDKDGKVTTANEALKIALASSGSADSRDFRLSAPIEITSGQNASNSVDLIVESDEDVGMEMLVLDATVSGEPAKGSETSTSEGVLTLELEDATDKKIWPKSETDAYPSITDPMEEAAGDEGLNPGESFMVEMDDLFHLKEGYSATYGATNDGSAVSISERGDVLTIEAEESGTSKVTVTGTASAAATFAPSQTVSNVAHVAFEVTVVDKELVVTLAADPMEIEEGGTSTITAMANRAVVAGDGDVAIDLSVVGHGTLDDDSITIAMGEMSGSAMLTAADNSDYGENDPITVVASGSGIDGQVSVSVSVMDNDEAPVEPEPTNSIEANPQDDAYPIITDAIAAGAGEEGFNPGESAMVDAADLFTVMDGYTASYAASVEGDAATASVSGSHVTVMAEMLGEAKVTITGTATEASSSFEAGQPATNVATVTFPVTVEDKGLRITLHAPDNVMEGNVVEGQSYHLTVQANRVVREDTVVSFGRDRAMSDAEEGTDYELDDVTMLAGSDSVRATLNVLEDMEPDSGTNDNMGEALVIYAMAGDAQSDDLHLTIWDQAVPALPLIAQLALALFLALGGARLYRRRQG